MSHSSFAEISPELSRDFRGLRVWLPIKRHGLANFRKELDEKLDLTDYANHKISELKNIKVVNQPKLTIIAFRIEQVGLSIDESNSMNRDWLKRINDRKNIFISGTILEGKFTLRFCILSFRTHLQDIEKGIRDLKETLL
jgi:aromatic-L-amino-acid decarboxylase